MVEEDSPIMKMLHSCHLPLPRLCLCPAGSAAWLSAFAHGRSGAALASVAAADGRGDEANGREMRSKYGMAATPNG